MIQKKHDLCEFHQNEHIFCIFLIKSNIVHIPKLPPPPQIFPDNLTNIDTYSKNKIKSESVHYTIKSRFG